MNNVFEFPQHQRIAANPHFGYLYCQRSDDSYTIFENIKNPDVESSINSKVLNKAQDEYSKFEYIEDVHQEDFFKLKNENIDTGKMNEKGFEDDMSGEDLDVPGSELDDADENIGSEDEENNYYSIGGDNHDNLEEDNG